MKKSIKLLLLAALAWPGWLSASAEVTPITAEKVLRPVYNKTTTDVCSNYNTNNNVPIRCNYVDEAVRGQMIYSANTLGITTDNYITSITFHANSNLSRYNNPDNATYSTITLKIGETTQSGYSSATFIETGLTRACTMSNGFFTGSQTVTFSFDEPYQYKGGNLVIDVSSDEAGNVYGSNVYWYGLSSNNGDRTCVYKSSSSASADWGRFLPYITVEHGTFTTVEADAPVSGNTDFFSQSDFDYTWKVNGVGEEEHSAKLTDIATDPDQIIALLKKVYTDKNIPGNLKRGYATAGLDDVNNPGDADYNVQYTGAGTIVRTGNVANFEDTYGWDIPGNVSDKNTARVNNRDYSYWYLDPEQYKPNQEGLTLLLLEMVDDFDPTTLQISATSGYAQLREYFAKTIKSARVITQSKRTGEGFEAGTLFKIDCDKMNKFYLIAKGQLQWKQSLLYETNSYNFDFYKEPCYIYGGNYDKYSDQALEKYFFLGHMFEQFSPALGNSDVTKDDIYQELTKNMQSFGVDHDCPNVPFVQNGHHFMMYEADSDPDDCQDVRDMMFFVPDYRMMYHGDRGVIQTNGSWTQDYFKYNPSYQPTMGMFIIRQNEIPTGTIIKSNTETMTGLYKHQLQWKSNLDEFLPGDQQYYELWEVVVDEFGVESYQPVYYRNADGEYTDANGTVVGEDNKVPIKLERESLHEFTYTDVYVDMKAGSQTKTYVIRGRDKGNFLSLQQSNQQEIVIPGLDPKEKVRMIGATYYSRYNPDNEKNCYSNKLEMQNNATGLTSDDTNKTLFFYRSSRKAQVDENGNVVTDDNGNIQYVGNDEVEKTCFAKGTFIGNNSLKIELLNQADKADYPDGKTSGDAAGYHTNKSPLTFQYTPTGTNRVLNFSDLYFWDNFTVDVSKNVHPLQYLYKMEAKTDEDADADAYSNDVRVPVYKTDSKINGSLTIDQVVADTQMNSDYSPGDVEFEAKVQLSSKTEILRYDAYRWIEKKNDNDHYYIIDEFGEDDNHNETEADLPPTGIAGNQGDFYTVSMNKIQEPEYYYVAAEADQPVVSTDQPSNWAKFVDKYPLKQAQDNNVIGSYVYAPVVELFTKGYKPNKVNNKMVERNDYNTYGGPMKNTAVGKLKVKAYQPTADDEGTDRAQMSEYKWFKDGDWYSYYNIYLNFEALDVPAGYELYKVRAWRQVEGGKDVLGEEVSTRESRAVDGWYMYEDMNFGDPLKISDGSATQPDVMSLSKLKGNGFNLGYRSNKIAKPVNPDGTGGGPVFEYDLTPNPNADNAAEEELIKHEMRATFGAKRLKTPEDDSGSLDELNAKFKVRAYFTKNTNPLTNASSTPDAEPIYVIGDIGNGWSNDVAAAELYSDNGTRYTGHIDIPGTNGKGYIRFTRKLNTPGEFFGANAEGNWIVNDEHYNTPLELKYWKSDSRPFEIPAGSYNLTIDLKPLSEAGDNNGWDAGTLTITRGSVAANAPRRAAMPGSDYDYYIAEGETKNIKLEGSSIITGISGVKADLNREVVSVTYVNPLGQQSSRPFGGVNMVVTRYSDGSATTTKVVK